MASRMAERVSHIGERARERMMESRMEKVDRENDKLRSEVRMLREDLQEERGALQEALQAMKRHETITVKTKKRSGLGRMLRTLVIGGGAYVLGTKAGRERYDKIMERAGSVKTKMQDRMKEPDSAPWSASTGASSPRTPTPGGAPITPSSAQGATGVIG
ncbi:MAG: hypothetical protein ABWZ53_08540 [Actinomycetota bacterium]